MMAHTWPCQPIESKYYLGVFYIWILVLWGCTLVCDSVPRSLGFQTQRGGSGDRPLFLCPHFQDCALQPHQHGALLLLCGLCTPGSATSAGHSALFRLLHGAAPHEGAWVAVGPLQGLIHLDRIPLSIVGIGGGVDRS